MPFRDREPVQSLMETMSKWNLGSYITKTQADEPFAQHFSLALTSDGDIKTKPSFNKRGDWVKLLIKLFHMQRPELSRNLQKSIPEM